MSSQVKPLVSLMLLVAGIGIARSSEAAFSLGPYRLGMSNAAAAKVGLSACRDAVFRGRKVVTCEGASLEPPVQIGRSSRGDSAPEFRPPLLSFDRSSKTLVRIELTVYGWGISDPRTPMLLNDLKVPPCPDTWGEPDLFDALLGRCFALPNQQRSIVVFPSKTFLRKVYPSRIEFDMSLGSDAQAFVKKRSAAARKVKSAAAREPKLDSFSKGR